MNDCDLVGCHRHLEVFAPPLEQGDQWGETTEHVTIWDGWSGGDDGVGDNGDDGVGGKEWWYLCQCCQIGWQK